MTRVVSSSFAEMAEEDCCVGEDCWVGDEGLGMVMAGLRRGDVRSIGELGAGCVSTPGKGMSKERSVADAEACWVSSGVMGRLCSGWRAWKDRGGSMGVCWVSSGVKILLCWKFDCCADAGAGGELRMSLSPSIGSTV